MADHSKPLVTSTYANFVTELDGRFDDIAKGLDPATTTPTNLPTGSIRWNSASSKWEKWSGTAWADLAVSYNINLAGPLTLTANSASDAFRITQTGAGNCLVVEDSANPDSSPFVIDTSGNVFVGKLTNETIGGANAKLQITGTGADALQSISRFVDSVSSPALRLSKSRGASVGTNTIVQSGDNLGQLTFYGADGSGYVSAVDITAAVDGTPGTNDMPGRLVFSTTADGASSPTERMRIDSAGRVGIGATPNAGEVLNVSKNPVGDGSGLGFTIRNYGTIQSSVTSTYYGNIVNVSTQAAAFTLSNLQYHTASQGAIGAGSSVTTQYGFHAASSLTGATNNYGFYSSIASGTGRWNFYAAGTADNFFAGRVLVGNDVFLQSATPALYVGGASVSTGECKIEVGSGRTGTGTSYIDLTGDTTYSDFGLRVQRETGGANAPSNITHRGTGVLAIKNIEAADITLWTSNTERMRIDSAGRVGIGATPTTTTNVYLNSNLTGNSNQFGFYNASQAQSDVTGNAYYFTTAARTAAAAFTVSSIGHYVATQGTFGAGSTVTNQYGFNVSSTLTGATNNYGFYSGIASGTGRWNFYAAGTAANYFAGFVGIGTTSPATQLHVSGTTPYLTLQDTDATAGFQNTVIANDTGNFRIQTFTSTNTFVSNDYLIDRDASGATIHAWRTANTERMRIDSSGNLIHVAPTTAPTLANNGTMVFNLTSNTNLRVSVRGSDGVTRTANITLA